MEIGCKLGCASFALAAILVWSGTAHATDDSAKGAARDLANEAKRDFDAGNFKEAGLKFQRAYDIAKVPTLAVWAARALVKQGRMVAASELYRQATRLAPNDLWVGNAQEQAQTDAGKELGALQPRIPKLRITVEGAEAKDVDLTVDNAKISTALLGIDIPADPGRRHIVVKKGTEVVERTVDLAEGERRETVLTFKLATPMLAQPAIPAEVPPVPPVALPKEASPMPTAAAAPTVAVTAVAPAATEAQPTNSVGGSQRTWGWVVLGVGAAGLLTGAVTGIVVMSNSSLRNDCPNGGCPASKSGSVDTYNLMRNVSTTGFIVGSVGAAVGVTLLLWTPKHESETRMALWLGPGSAGVKGAF